MHHSRIPALVPCPDPSLLRVQMHTPHTPQITLADRNFEAAELRREVANSWTVSEPNLLQLRQLLLDPAVNREYVRMRAELEEAQREVKKLQVRF